MHTATYADIVSELYHDTKLSDSDEENNALKQIIANVQFWIIREII